MYAIAYRRPPEASGIDGLAGTADRIVEAFTRSGRKGQPERELKHGDVGAALGRIDQDQRHLGSSSRSARSTRASRALEQHDGLPKSFKASSIRPGSPSRWPTGQHQALKLIAVEPADDRDQGSAGQDVARPGAAAGLSAASALVEEPVLQQCGVARVNAAAQGPGVGVDVRLLEKSLESGLGSA